MKYINSSFEEINIDEKLCLTIGNFDGIHKGHREIIKNLIQKTNILKSKSAILSFTPHPKIYFKKQNNFMINSQLKKKEILESLGLDYLIDLHFNKKFTQLNHLEFEDKILLGKLNAKKILIGRDFQYGNQRKGNIETLRIFCKKNNIQLNEIDLIFDELRGVRGNRLAARDGLAKEDLAVIFGIGDGAELFRQAILRDHGAGDLGRHFNIG